MPAAPDSTGNATAAPAATSPRTRLLLEAPIAPTLTRLALPNMLVAFAQMAVAIMDAWYVGQLGVAPLAALALVFPVQSLMTMMSAGAMGGGISSAVARALGAGNYERAESVAMHAFVIAAGMAAIFTILFGVLARPLFSLLGGTGAALDAAVSYAHVLFGCSIVIWLANTTASLVRGTGNMAVPGAVFTIAAVVNVILSGALTLGWWGAPRLGVSGPAVAMIISFLGAAAVLAGYLASGRTGVKLRLTGIKLRPAVFMDIMKVGLVACGNALLTIATIVIVTALVARYGTAALAGYGLGSRLELLLIPIAFGFGGAMTAMVGVNRGARGFKRARQIAWTGGLTVFAMSGLIGMAVALFPDLWISLFTTSPEATETARLFFWIVGPFFAFFGLGQSLYFATQGTGNMAAPFTAGTFRLLVAAGIGSVVTIWAGLPLAWLFVCVSAGFVTFGGLLAYALWRGRTWNPET